MTMLKIETNISNIDKELVKVPWDKYFSGVNVRD